MDFMVNVSFCTWQDSALPERKRQGGGEQVNDTHLKNEQLLIFLQPTYFVYAYFMHKVFTTELLCHPCTHCMKTTNDAKGCTYRNRLTAETLFLKGYSNASLQRSYY